MSEELNDVEPSFFGPHNLPFKMPKEFDDPKFHVLLAQFGQMNDSVNQMHETLSKYLANTRTALNTQIVEVGRGQADGSGTFGFNAQTSDLEIITAFYAYFPLTATDITLTFGSKGDQLNQSSTLPIAPGFSNIQGMNYRVRRPYRTLTWGNVQATDAPFIVLFGHAAPTIGVLH